MYSILLVEDEKWVRAALKWTIEQLNMPFKVVMECSNGLEALDWLKSNHADLILTDINMPIMDGLSLIKEINNRQLNIYSIIITVHEDFSFIRQALREGVCDYLLKPVEEESLKECLEKWIGKANLRVSTKEKDLDNVDQCPINKVLQYIDITHPGEITLTDAAKYVHMNPSYLSQLFKHEMKINFVDYITELKISEACKLLKCSKLRICEIADRVGYADIAYFSNSFKKMTGMTPSEYRRADILDKFGNV